MSIGVDVCWSEHVDDSTVACMAGRTATSVCRFAGGCWGDELVASFSDPIPDYVGRIEIGCSRAETRPGSGHIGQLSTRLRGPWALRARWLVSGLSATLRRCDVHCSPSARKTGQRETRRNGVRSPYTAARIYSSSSAAVADPPATASLPSPARACDRESAPCSSLRAHCSTLSLLSNIYPSTTRPGASYTLYTPLATSPTDIPFSPTSRQNSH